MIEKIKNSKFSKKIQNSKRYKQFMAFLDVLRPMTWTKRIDHIWYHYKEGIIIGLILMILPIGMIASYFNSLYDTIFAGAIINIDGTKECRSFLTDNYFEKLNGDPKSQRVELTVLAFEEPNENTHIENNYNSAMTPLAMVEAGILDYVILDEFAMEYYIVEEMYMDLSLVFSEDELKAFEANKQLIYLQAEGTANRYPAIIDISDLPFAKENLYVRDGGKAYFAFCGPDEKGSEYHDFWEYFVSWESKEAA